MKPGAQRRMPTKGTWNFLGGSEAQLAIVILWYIYVPTSNIVPIHLLTLLFFWVLSTRAWYIVGGREDSLNGWVGGWMADWMVVWVNGWVNG